MAKPKRVGHLVLNVKNLDVSTKFYTDILGFDIALQRTTGTFLTCGKIHHDLALFQAPEGAMPVTEGQLGLNHFAVQVEDLDDLKEIYAELKDSGATMDRNTDHGMTSSIYFFDPDGNKIEFFCNNTDTAREGLDLMKSPDRINKELVLD
ncbi:MAG: VOC family protein [Chloroflexota bacterium]|nr:VOC family protein [Chloroflexota bacterium]